MSKAKKAVAGSENEDDPEIYESSGEEWNSDTEQPNKKRGGGRRASKRVTKKQKVQAEESSEPESENEEEEEELEEEESDDEYDEEEDEDDPKGKSKNGVNKKKKKENIAKITTTTRTTTDKDGKETVTSVKCIQSSDYSTGSFVILRKDAQMGDPKKKPSIWRIDGKALLQKYESFTEDGIVRHKNTSIYNGWSPLDKELYAPIMVYVHKHHNQNMVVEVNWDELKDINLDSE